MSQQSAAAPESVRQPLDQAARQPLDAEAAASVRAYVADQRARVELLASVLEDIAAHGYPAAESGLLWEDARDAHLKRLADEEPRVA
ncbi:hypothetical protein [Streptomyces sp. NPDC058486]|uniref:hypothetical protein n=1 Tax=unclassified Streptomyces TaxID=2593676 RepID=UPI00365EE7FF